MNFRGLAARIWGVDLDPRVVDNPMLDEGKIADAGGIPYPDAAFDVVFADNVLEHLPDPLAVFREDRPRAQAGGGISVQDPQQNPLHAHHRPAHPAPLPSIRQPHSRPGRSRHLPHSLPRQHLRRLCNASPPPAASRFKRLDRIEGRPEYLRMTWPTYLLGATYERLVNAWDGLALFEILLVRELRKG